VRLARLAAPMTALIVSQYRRVLMSLAPNNDAASALSQSL
jgi:hypothetical protein